VAESDRPGASDDADASGPHADAHDVTLDRKRDYRNIAEENVAAAGKVRSNPDADTADRKNLRKILPSAGPRAPQRERLPRPGTPAVAVLDNGGFAHVDALGPRVSRGTAGRHASAASHGPHPDIACCNSDCVDEPDEMAAHTPSAGTDGTADDRTVELHRRIGHTQVGPREVMLPQGKSRSGVGRSAPGRFFARLVPQLTPRHRCVQKFSGALPPRLNAHAIAICTCARRPLRREPLVAVWLP
jgi:hypothetical protein